eukprot:gene13964-biopygen17058
MGGLGHLETDGRVGLFATRSSPHLPPLTQPFSTPRGHIATWLRNCAGERRNFRCREVGDMEIATVPTVKCEGHLDSTIKKTTFRRGNSRKSWGRAPEGGGCVDSLRTYTGGGQTDLPRTSRYLSHQKGETAADASRTRPAR